jgi:hypothetical protein
VVDFDLNQWGKPGFLSVRPLLIWIKPQLVILRQLGLMKSGNVTSPLGQAAASSRLANVEIRIRLSTLDQLFNSMDPSPFHEKELDVDAEEFIVSSLDELPLTHTPALVIELPADQVGVQDGAAVQKALHNHFSYRLSDGRRRLHFQFREGRIALLIGLMFLSICVAVRQLIFAPIGGTLSEMFSEGLLILGWVAMWRPLQVFLYEWWPIRHQSRLYAKLAAIPVTLRPVVPPPTVDRGHAG